MVKFRDSIDDDDSIFLESGPVFRKTTGRELLLQLIRRFLRLIGRARRQAETLQSTFASGKMSHFLQDGTH